MIRVYVMVEGQTEETFVRELLYSHFIERDIFLIPILFRTSKEARGGIVSYGKVRNQVVRKCREDQGAVVTTLIDLNGLPTNFPGFGAQQHGSPYDRAQQLEKTFSDDIGQPNFVPHFTVHEFEGLLFSDVAAFGAYFDDPGLVASLAEIDRAFENPEHINDGTETAPSKRIIHALGGAKYQKPVHGPLIAMDIGLECIRERCPHFKGSRIQLTSATGGLSPKNT